VYYVCKKIIIINLKAVIEALFSDIERLKAGREGDNRG